MPKKKRKKQWRKNGEKDDYVFLISNFEKEEAEEEEQGGDYIHTSSPECKQPERWRRFIAKQKEHCLCPRANNHL